QGPCDPPHDLPGARRVRLGPGQPLHRAAARAPTPRPRRCVPLRRTGPGRRGTLVMAGHAITAAALANCLGTDSRTVLDRAFAGDDAFSPASAFHEFPFSTMLGVMPGIEAHRGLRATDSDRDDDALDCILTRLAMAALPWGRPLRPAVRAAVARWGARRVAYVFASSTGGLDETERALAPDPRLPLAGARYRYTDHGIDATSQAIARHLGVDGVS